MKKIFTLCAALICAAAMAFSAESTTPINDNGWLRYDDGNNCSGKAACSKWGVVFSGSNGPISRVAIYLDKLANYENRTIIMRVATSRMENAPETTKYTQVLTPDASTAGWQDIKLPEEISCSSWQYIWVYIELQSPYTTPHTFYAMAHTTNKSGHNDSYYFDTNYNQWLVNDYPFMIRGYFKNMVPVDKTELGKAIDELNELSGYVATASLAYPDLDLSDITDYLATAISNAQAVNEDANAKQSDVDEATADAQSAAQQAKEDILQTAKDYFSAELEGLIEEDEKDECRMIITSAMDKVAQYEWNDNKSTLENIIAAYTAGKDIYDKALAALNTCRGEATGIEDVDAFSNFGESRRTLREGVLYIERDGKTYNAQGAQVR